MGCTSIVQSGFCTKKEVFAPIVQFGSIFSSIERVVLIIWSSGPTEIKVGQAYQYLLKADMFLVVIHGMTCSYVA